MELSTASPIFTPPVINVLTAALITSRVSPSTILFSTGSTDVDVGISVGFNLSISALAAASGLTARSTGVAASNPGAPFLAMPFNVLL